MTDDTKHIILDNKYARIIKELSGMYNIGMDEAADIFYNSELLPLIENGVADLQGSCTSITEKAVGFQTNRFFSDPDRIQTCNLHIRSVTLYSVELRGRKTWECKVKPFSVFLGCKGMDILNNVQIFLMKFR